MAKGGLAPVTTQGQGGLAGAGTVDEMVDLHGGDVARVEGAQARSIAVASGSRGLPPAAEYGGLSPLR